MQKIIPKPQIHKLRPFGISRENENSIIKRSILKGFSLKSLDYLFQSFVSKDYASANFKIISLIESLIDDTLEINGYPSKKSGFHKFLGEFVYIIIRL